MYRPDPLISFQSQYGTNRKSWGKGMGDYEFDPSSLAAAPAGYEWVAGAYGIMPALQAMPQTGPNWGALSLVGAGALAIWFFTQKKSPLFVMPKAA